MILVFRVLVGKWDGERNPYGSVPDGFVLVLLRGIGCAILLSVTGHAHIALCELGEWLSSKLGLKNGQF